jgi:hypothetical protein
MLMRELDAKEADMTDDRGAEQRSQFRVRHTTQASIFTLLASIPLSFKDGAGVRERGEGNAVRFHVKQLGQ